MMRTAAANLRRRFSTAEIRVISFGNLQDRFAALTAYVATATWVLRGRRTAAITDGPNPL